MRSRRGCCLLGLLVACSTGDGEVDTNTTIVGTVIDAETAEPLAGVVITTMPVTVQVAGSSGVIGSRVKVLDKDGKPQGSVQYICGGEGRGGQKPLSARFALTPGTYKVEVRYSSGITRVKDIVVAAAPVRGVIDDQTPKVE